MNPECQGHGHTFKTIFNEFVNSEGTHHEVKWCQQCGCAKVNAWIGKEKVEGKLIVPNMES